MILITKTYSNQIFRRNCNVIDCIDDCINRSQSFPSTLNIPSVRIEEDKDPDPCSVGSITTIDSGTPPPKPFPRRPTLAKLHNFTTMTPQEIAQWIDKRSRIVFPISFIIFNILYWSFIWIWDLAMIYSLRFYNKIYNKTWNDENRNKTVEVDGIF